MTYITRVCLIGGSDDVGWMKTNKRRVEIVLNNLLNTETEKKKTIERKTYQFSISGFLNRSWRVWLERAKRECGVTALFHWIINVPIVHSGISAIIDVSVTSSFAVVCLINFFSRIFLSRGRKKEFEGEWRRGFFSRLPGECCNLSVISHQYRITHF